jgi:signal transduction histidine kinase
LQDLMIAKRVARLSNHDRSAIRRSFLWVMINTLLSAVAISSYVISVAMLQTSGEHFTPLFFLFAAALFAAMNNHQVVWALVLRLTVYGLAFMFIVVKDLWVLRPPLSSELWLQFFTVIFVMYFLIDCSVVFLKLYRKNLAQLEELKLEHERTKNALVVKSQFVSIVSHELRTPLTSIKGALDLINSGAVGEVPDRMVPLIEMANKNGQRLGKLIDDLLDLQKIEAGEMTFRREVVSLQALVDEAVASNQGFAENHDVVLKQGHMEHEPLYVLADEVRLMQVVTNMISNAAKFSSAGGDVLVGCSLEGGRARIFVQDHGVGIPEGNRDKVFGRFTQVDSSDKRRYGGTGLGMNISKEIIEYFDGVIDYESTPGKGSTFFIDLPRYRGPAEKPREIPVEGRGIATKATRRLGVNVEI